MGFQGPCRSRMWLRRWTQGLMCGADVRCEGPDVWLDTDTVAGRVSRALSLAAVRIPLEPHTMVVGAVPAACMALLACQLTGTPLEGTAGLGL